MADIQDFTMVRNGSVSFSIPRFTGTASFTSVIDSSTVLGIFNGTFPSTTIFNQFTAQELEDAFKEMYIKMVRLKAAQL